MTQPFVIDLPLPTSANRMWRAGRGRIYKNPDYLEWIRHADGLLLASGLNRGRSPVAGRYRMKVIVREHIRLDPDNTIKPLSDWAQHAGIIKNDKHLRALALEYGDIGNDCRLVIEELA